MSYRNLGGDWQPGGRTDRTEAPSLLMLLLDMAMLLRIVLSEEVLGTSTGGWP